MVRRSYGWLLGAASVAGRGLRAPGVLAGLVWGLTTNAGQTLMAKAVRAVSTAVSTAAGAVGKAVGWTLRLFGTPGARLATWLDSKLTAVTQAATDRAQQLKTLSGLLRSQNLPAKAVGAIARERLLRTLVGRFLPRPWSWLVRIVANLALLPTAVLRDASTVVAGVVPGMHPGPAPAPVGTAPAATDPTPTAPAPTVVPAEAPAAPTTPPGPAVHRRGRRTHPGQRPARAGRRVGTEPDALPGAQAVGGQEAPLTHSTTSTASTTSGRLHRGGGLRHA